MPDETSRGCLIGIRSTEDLLGKLLLNQWYLLAEKLWEWGGGNAISIDMFLRQIVQLPASVDPSGYLHLLKRIIFPNLKINNELLPILKAWSCEAADQMDENQVGLSPAISLLEVGFSENFVVLLSHYLTLCS